MTKTDIASRGVEDESANTHVIAVPDLLHAPWINAAPPEIFKIFKNLKSITFHDSMVILEKGPIISRQEAISTIYKDSNFEWN